jgi:hypothetical protein
MLQILQVLAKVFKVVESLHHAVDAPVVQVVPRCIRVHMLCDNLDGFLMLVAFLGQGEEFLVVTACLDFGLLFFDEEVQV